MKQYDHRGVEGISSFGFIAYPIYGCSNCKRTKSSLELCDLMTMGVPSYILRRCPVIPMSRTCYSSELAELILTLRTGELGAGQISNYIEKKRATFWATQARVYLEAHVANKDDSTSLNAFGFTQDVVCQPFPAMRSHCGGFGGTKGPSGRQIQRFFLQHHHSSWISMVTSDSSQMDLQLRNEII